MAHTNRHGNSLELLIIIIDIPEAAALPLDETGKSGKLST